MKSFVTDEQLRSAISLMEASIPEVAYLAPDEDRMFTSHNLLPHSNCIGKLQHVVWRTEDSIPQEKVKELKRQEDLFKQSHPEPWDNKTLTDYQDTFEKKLNALIDKGYGKCPMKSAECREVIIRLFTEIHSSEADLYAFCVMPNHIHLLLRNHVELKTLVNKLKSRSAAGINCLIDSEGQLWYRNYFDRMMRTENQFESTIYYIINNPRYVPSGEYSIWVRGLGEINWSSRFRRPIYEA